MQTLAFLCFELQVAQQRLRASFAQSEVPAKARNRNSAKAGVPDVLVYEKSPGKIRNAIP